MSKLVLFLPDGTTLDIPLDRERTTIGRRADNDICLPNLAVSGQHAVVVTILDDSFLEDLNSTNGTLVNGDAVAKHFLRDRDQIDIGRHRLVYCLDNEAKLDPVVAEGIARVSVRDFGEKVESAKPFERVPQAAGAGSPSTRAKETADSQAVLVTPAAPAESTRPQPNAVTPEAAPKIAPAQPKSAMLQPAPSRTVSEAPSIKLLSGVGAGTVVALTKTETTIGRPGIQVASIGRNGTAFWLKPLEGASPPKVNGKPVTREGVELAHADAIDIAGTKLEFVYPQTQVAQQDVAA